ncbi:lipopolysaccharide assembly protein LapA domain-containing protein [Thalassospira sp. TSL5-1]|uniref:lipopolysaccharide assembly protein LapA domain-containing protein n=1 Tax=Thalassospira sp. TSL5-1 TaxID=1544451 RepID=UPI00093C309B|nr:lipopolysaccharide assembly protein LapA domain-containing protein [Thalassospira sp. TSL5-1]
MRVLYWIIAIPLTIVITVFAVANRQATTLSLWPLPFEMDLPLFVPVLGALLLGLLIGLLFEWLLTGKHRRANRKMESELSRLRREKEAAREQERAAIASQKQAGQPPMVDAQSKADTTNSAPVQPAGV